MSDKVPLRFPIDNAARPGKQITLAGYDFGGAGKPLALLHHANGFAAGTWELVARELIDHYHVIALDARGHGNSEGGRVPDDFAWGYFVEDLARVAHQLLRQHDQEAVAFGIGSSFGGIITAAAEAWHPGLFQRIALLDPPIHPTEQLVARFGLDLDAGNPVKAMLVAQTLKRRTHWPSLDVPRDSWRHKGMFADWSDEAFAVYLAECLEAAPDGGVRLKCNPEVEAHIFETTGSLDVLDYASDVEVPVLYLRAETGNVPAAFCEQVAGLFKRSTFDEIAGGHLLPLEVPDRVVERLLAFAASD